MNVLESIFRRVGELGSRHVFGIPGREAVAFEGLERCGIRYIVCRHEQGAGFMANGYGRALRRPGLCHTTFGPGVTNLVTSLADAYLDRVPVLAICAQVECNRREWGTHQYVDTRALLGPVTKHFAELDSALGVLQTVDAIYNLAATDPPGPVVLSVPIDVLCSEVSVVTHASCIRNEPVSTAPPVDASSAIDSFVHAKHPIIFCGAQMARMSAPIGLLRELVELGGIPCITTYAAKGVVSEASSYSLGPAGRYMKRGSRVHLEACDLLLVLGYESTEGGLDLVLESIPAAAQRVVIGGSGDIQNDDGSGACSLESFVQRLAASLSPSTTIHHRTAPNPHRTAKCQSVIQLSGLINALSNHDVPIVSDVGLHKHLLALHYVADQPNRIHFSSGLGCAGSALPTAMGMSIGLAEGPVHVVTGDGGFLMNVQELETLSRLSLPITVVVLVDNAFGLIRAFEREAWGGSFGVGFGNPEFSALGKAFGIDTLVCGSVEEGSKTLQSNVPDKPRLVIVPIDYEAEDVSDDTSRV